MRMRRLWAVAALAGLGLAATVTVRPSLAAEVTKTDGCVDSVPEPGSTAAVPICYSLFRPAGADAANPVPMVLHSHGWGGSRTTDPAAFDKWMKAGFGVLSFDQRGWGQSGGQAHIEHPDFEGQDVQRLVDLVAGLDWVAKDGPGDPVLGSIGGSYGGGYQFVGAFTELRDRGATRFNAMAPEITWWDLKQSLAPQEVVRTAWDVVLYAAGMGHVPNDIHEGFVYGAATGNWPKGEVPGADLDAFFEKNGPAWHVKNGRVLDIPVLFGQGITDNLFNLNQGLQNFDHALTPAARSKSIFVGYNGGHTLPSVLPPGVGAAGDPCSKALSGGSFQDLTIRFFTEALRHQDTGLTGRGRYHLATAGGACVDVDSVAPTTAVDLGQVISTAGVGAPIPTKLADGPITIAGAPVVDAKVTTVTPDARAFFALGVGTSPADMQIVQNNMMPLREVDPVSAVARTITLPGVAVEVPKGQSLYLVVSPISDMFFGHGSRVPGAIVLDDTVVRLPVPGAAVQVEGTSQTRPAPVEGQRSVGTLAATGPSGPAPVLGLMVLAALLVLRRRLAL
ncbi:MAG: type transport system ATP-binding protein [Pseudonocardiales bacterium]|nr:type transport system ATP-binding protein [Pseudonocardiales bacterium]